MPSCSSCPTSALRPTLSGPRFGALIYNAAHSYLAPMAMMTGGFATAEPLILSIAMIWLAHIGFDRALGYGLKYASGFGFTHMGRIGKKSNLLMHGVQTFVFGVDTSVFQRVRSSLGNYASATGGDVCFSESQSTLESCYLLSTEEARNQYVLGYRLHEQTSGYQAGIPGNQGPGLTTGNRVCSTGRVTTRLRENP